MVCTQYIATATHSRRMGFHSQNASRWRKITSLTYTRAHLSRQCRQCPGGGYFPPECAQHAARSFAQSMLVVLVTSVDSAAAAAFDAESDAMHAHRAFIRAKAKIKIQFNIINVLVRTSSTMSSSSSYPTMQPFHFTIFQKHVDSRQSVSRWRQWQHRVHIFA